MLTRVLLASSNLGKLREYRELAAGTGVELDLLPNFQTHPPFDESALTFAEIGAAKALHYSRFTSEMVLADDSGLVVPALGGAPGVRSARYAGPNATDEENNRKLLREMQGRERDQRRARFVCVTALARSGRALAIVSDSAQGSIVQQPRGTGGFGYDPLFYSPELGCTFAEAPAPQKNRRSHRGKAFAKILALLAAHNF
ncbi:MAG TPA: RdgB/HAM1 family non-canonical purine NTP pyrophosphatase [Candidatus Dormibacteraeota bacterium]|nr:RdgB/HAM1 family non-canonical purine NTP pyrophosphatase [Candidatus Dormibacteraeota bacterium]